MARLISDKYKEWEAECEARFNQLKANEEDPIPEEMIS